MFLEGCSSPQLGCTVLLRGAPTSELAKLKRVASWLIFAVYNWRLERSFLMDEFANPPTVSVDNFFENIPSSEKKKKLQDSKSVDSLRDKFGLPITTSSPTQEVMGVLNGSPASLQLFQPSKIDDENNKVHNILDDIHYSRSRKIAIKTSSEIEFDSKKGLSVSEYNSEKLNEYSSKNISRLMMKDKSLSDERKMNVESISDFSDPLHQYLNLEDEVFSEHPTGQALSVEELPQPNRFCQALDDTILSVSPFLKVSFFFILLKNCGVSNCYHYLRKHCRCIETAVKCNIFLMKQLLFKTKPSFFSTVYRTEHSCFKTFIRF